MVAQTADAVTNNVVINHPAQFLKLVQVGHLYGHLFANIYGMEELETREVRKEYQEYLAATFCPAAPAAYESFCKVFEAERWGLIVGEPGNGRETAAIALHTHCGLQVHAVPLSRAQDDPHGEKPHTRLARTMPMPNTGYVVDLSAIEADEKVVSALRGLKERVEECGAALTVITRSGAYAVQLPEAPAFTVDRPNAIDVLAKHLSNLPGTKGWEPLVRWPEVRRLMAEASPADAARMANIAYRALSAHDAQSGTDKWITDSIAAYGDWKTELEAWFAEHKGGSEAAWDRIVLIAVAVLEELDSMEVLKAADALAQKTGIEPGDAGGLTGLGVEPTLKAVGAERGKDGSVRFARPEYAAAALDYVWEQLPRLQESLLAWTDILAAGDSKEVVRAVGEAWIGLALRRREPALMTQLFEVWMEGAAPRQAVVDLAAKVASSPDFGSMMRRRLYAIARKPKTDEHAVVVAQACAAYSQTDPLSALFRLKWLAQAESEKARGAALDALEEMARDPEQWFDVVRVIVDEWCHSGVRAERREVARRFITGCLARSGEGIPELLSRIESEQGPQRERIRRHAADMWGAVLDQRVDELVLEAAGPWIMCVLDSEAGFDTVAGIFVEAVSGGERALGGAEASRRTVALGKVIVEWCDRNGVDHGRSAVHRLLARLYTANEPLRDETG